MTRSASISCLGSEFDDFLFAPIGEDRNDIPLSVVSALARLDIDPWQEADTLARLPRETATQRLASLIAALPNAPSANLDPGTIAARLIVRLPRRARSKIPSREVLLGGGAVMNPRVLIYVVIINAIIAITMMGAQWVATSRQVSAQVDNAHVLASSTVFAQTPPPNSGR